MSQLGTRGCVFRPLTPRSCGRWSRAGRGAGACFPDALCGWQCELYLEQKWGHGLGDMDGGGGGAGCTLKPHLGAQRTWDQAWTGSLRPSHTAGRAHAGSSAHQHLARTKVKVRDGEPLPPSWVRRDCGGWGGGASTVWAQRGAGTGLCPQRPTPGNHPGLCVRLAWPESLSLMSGLGGTTCEVGNVLSPPPRECLRAGCPPRKGFRLILVSPGCQQRCPRTLPRRPLPSQWCRPRPSP